MTLSDYPGHDSWEFLNSCLERPVVSSSWSTDVVAGRSLEHLPGFGSQRSNWETEAIIARKRIHKECLDTKLFVFCVGSCCHDGWHLTRHSASTGTRFEKQRSMGICFGNRQAVPQTPTSANSYKQSIRVHRQLQKPQKGGSTNFKQNMP